MEWMEGPIYVFDTETTGVDPGHDRIVQLAILRFEPGKRWSEMEAWVTRASPDGVRIAPGAKLAHGIEESELVGLPPIEKKLKQIVKILRQGKVFMAYNASFDVQMLEAARDRAGIADKLPFTSSTVIDPLVFARHLYPDLRSRKLGQMATCLGISYHQLHDALQDTKITAEVMLRMAMKNTLPSDLSGLFAMQQKLRERWEARKTQPSGHRPRRMLK